MANIQMIPNRVETVGGLLDVFNKYVVKPITEPIKKSIANPLKLSTHVNLLKTGLAYGIAGPAGSVFLSSSKASAKSGYTIDEAFAVINEINNMSGGNDISMIGREGLDQFIYASNFIQSKGSLPVKIKYATMTISIWKNLGDMYKRTVESVINQFSPIFTSGDPVATTQAVTQFQQFLDFLNAMSIGKLRSQNGFAAGNALGKDFIVKLKQYAIAAQSNIKAQVQAQAQAESIANGEQTSPIPIILAASAAGLGLFLITR